ncbi:MAG: fructokinase [Desulforhopalus sp.]|jgi:fructokinase
MKNQSELYIFGEVLFDCFSTGEEILGGAPFNVAWNLQALGDQPLFISRIGIDVFGDRILEAMRTSGMDSAAIQMDDKLPTGRVEVTIHDDEPCYNIVANCAYDFISADQLPDLVAGGILYHGTLCLRNQTSHDAYSSISQHQNLNIFLDVNLRSPWWQRDEVLDWISKAHWVKMNEEELGLLSDSTTDIRLQMTELQTTYGLEQVIVTRGAEGTLIRDSDGTFHSLIPDKVERLVDTVGAGDAFSSVYIHGLLAGWPIDVNLYYAQQFAGKVIGLRGATTTDLNFYQEFMGSISVER